MNPTREAFEALADTFTGSLPVALALAAVALAAALHWIDRRRRSSRPRETLLVGRWGTFGPELYLVGESVRRLLGSEDLPHPARAFAQAFAEARLEPLPPDGFVLSTSEAQAWLDRL